MAYRYSKDPIVNRSLQHSVRDGVAYSVMAGGGETYLSAFAIFLKASAPQIALLSSLPPLLGSLTQFMAAWLGSKYRRRIPIILIAACVQGLSWIPLLFLPLLFTQHSVMLLIFCVTVYHAAGNLAAPLWISLMGDIVPERKRGRFFSRRTRLASLTAFIALACAGMILHYFDYHQSVILGFSVLFSIAFVARLI